MELVIELLGSIFRLLESILAFLGLAWGGLHEFSRVLGAVRAAGFRARVSSTISMTFLYFLKFVIDLLLIFRIFCYFVSFSSFLFFNF